jgi:hypothetical protein
VVVGLAVGVAVGALVGALVGDSVGGGTSHVSPSNPFTQVHVNDSRSITLVPASTSSGSSPDPDSNMAVVKSLHVPPLRQGLDSHGGACVGCADGDAVGSEVGLVLGVADGAAVGDVVGFALGAKDGAAVGAAVGAVGVVVGWGVGLNTTTFVHPAALVAGVLSPQHRTAYSGALALSALSTHVADPVYLCSSWQWRVTRESAHTSLYDNAHQFIAP